MGEQVVHSAPVVVTLPAEIDLTNSELASRMLTAAFMPGVTVVIANMTGTVFCDTAGTRALVRAHQEAAARGITLRFAVPANGGVRRVLELTGLIRMLPVYASLDEALHSG
jgi:anti-sigma B factor antagonist